MFPTQHDNILDG